MLMEYADKTDSGSFSADNFDLASFYKSGAKLLHYHGHSDAIVPPGIGIFFREKIAETVEKQSINIDDFYRLFLIPGMQQVAYPSP